MAATITVNSTDDSNIRDAVLTLREAILIANGTLNVPALTVAEQAQINNTVGTAADRDTIAFNIGAIGSQQLIQPLSALPPSPIQRSSMVGVKAARAITVCHWWNSAATSPDLGWSDLISLLGTVPCKV